MITQLWALASPAFSIADRGIGGALKRSHVIGCLAVLIILEALTGGIVPASLTIAWIIYRTLPWAFGGTLTPRTPIQIVGSFLRHSMPAMAAFGLCIFGFTNFLTVVAMMVYALYATLLSKYYANSVDKIVDENKDNSEKHLEQAKLNEKIEIFRGILFSIAFAVSVIFG